MRLNCRVASRLAAILVIALSGALARAQILEQVPAEALVVMKVNNLQQTSTKLAKLCQDLGVAQMAPQMADPLGTVQAQLKMNNGLDKSGEMAFIMLDPSVVGGDMQKTALMLWPVTDYKAFLGNFPDAKEENGVTTLHLANNPQDMYMSNWGKYAAIAASKDVTAMKPTGLKVQGATAKELQKDFAVYANMPRIREIARPKLKENREQIITQMETQLAQDPDVAKYSPVIKAALNRFMDLADQFLAETQSAVYSVNLADNGISTAIVAEFADGSALGNGIKSVKNSNDPLLTGIPEGKYLFFGGSQADPQLATSVLNSLIDPVSKEMSAVGGDQAAAFQKYVDALKKYVGALKGQSVGWIAPSGALGQDPLMQMLSIQWGDAATLKSGYVEMVRSQDALMKAFGAQAADAVKTETKPAAKTIDGVAFDVTTSQFNVQAAGPGAAQAQMMMNWLYGPNGATIYTGQVGEKMLVGIGVSDGSLTSAITAIKGNQDPLDNVAGVKTVAAQLPQQRVAQFYVPLDQIVTTIASYAGQMGMNVQVQLPPDLPPIGMTVSTEGTSARLDSFTPTELVKAIVAAGMQTYMQMHGAGGAHPGGPGGL